MIQNEKVPTKSLRTRPILKGLAGFSALLTALTGCKGATVFYEPTNSQSYAMPADDVLTRAEWAIGNCRTDYSDNFAPTIADKPVDTLAGWSLGRLGIAYFLEESSGLQRDQVNHLVYFDPANYEDYTTNVCDQRNPSQSVQLKAWLSEDPNNHVTVVAGAYTVDAGNPNALGQTSAGVREMLFSEISGTALANQVKVCEDADAGHAETLTLYADLMAQSYSETCPDGTIMWRP